MANPWPVLAQRMKAKTKCKNGHPFDEANTARRSDGARSCRICHDIAYQKWKAKNPGRQRELQRQRNRRYRERHPERAALSRGRWIAAHPGALRAVKVKHMYQLNIETIVAKLAEQGNACAICGTTDAKLVVDHCHETKLFRGMLCRQCNVMLGAGRDRPEVLAAAVEYLNRTKGA